MYHPSLAEVRELGRDANLVPVWRALPADLETPVSVYLKLRGQGASFLLESVEKGEQLGRYSFLGVSPAATLVVHDGEAVLRDDGEARSVACANGDPLSAAASVLAKYRPAYVDGLPRFLGGLVGYVGYESVRFFESVPLAARPGIDLPDAVFLLADVLVIFDHVMHRLLVVANAHIDADAGQANDDARR